MRPLRTRMVLPDTEDPFEMPRVQIQDMEQESRHRYRNRHQEDRPLADVSFGQGLRGDLRVDGIPPVHGARDREGIPRPRDRCEDVIAPPAEKGPEGVWFIRSPVSGAS